MKLSSKGKLGNKPQDPFVLKCLFNWLWTRTKRPNEVVNEKDTEVTTVKQNRAWARMGTTDPGYTGRKFSSSQPGCF